MSAATSTTPAAYEAWGVEGRKPVLLGVGATKGDCDRIHRHHEGGGIIVRGGIVVAVKTGTVPAAKASLQHAAFAAYRERGDLPAPTETDRQRERIERIEAERERQRAALRLVAPLPEERADEGDDEESDEGDEEPARAADDCDEPEDNEDDEDLDEAPETTPDDQDDEPETHSAEAPVDRDPKPANNTVTSVESTTEATTPPRACAAHGCKSPRDVTRSTTRPEVADLCSEHRMLARRIQHNRGVELAAAAQQLRERGYVPIAPQATAARAAPRRAAPTGCPVSGCGKPSAPAQARTAPELADLCTRHRTRVRDLLGKVPGYTPALARERIITGQRPAGMAPALSASERGARGGKARTKILRPAVAETVRRVPAVPATLAPAPVLAALAPAGSPLGERVAVVRRLVACEARAGGVDVVERLVELADRYGADEIVALVNAAYGGAA